MKSLQIQIQPDLQPDLDGAKIARRLRRIGKTIPFPVRVRLSKGVDKSHYINIQFFTENIRALWSVLQKELLKNMELAGCVIVICQGIAGWDDYLLLHHFDHAQRLDQLD